MSPAAGVDPVRERRARIARLVVLGKRLGYSLYLVAVVAFVLGFVTDFGPPIGPLIVGSLLVGSVFLAPAIVLGYAVKAGERDDRERGL